MSAQKVLEFFKAMNQFHVVPVMKKTVSDWLVAFAKARNLEVEQDSANNVLIRKAATPGYENRPASFCKVIWIWFVKKVTLQPMIS